jgi:hypothetical protein
VNYVIIFYERLTRLLLFDHYVLGADKVFPGRDCLNETLVRSQLTGNGRRLDDRGIGNYFTNFVSRL